MGYTEKTKIESDDATEFLNRLIEKDFVGSIVKITKEPIVCDCSGKQLGYHYTAYIESYEM